MVSQDQQQLRYTKTMQIKINTLVIGAGAGGLGAGCWLKAEKVPFLIVEGSDGVPHNLNNGVHYLHSIPDLPFQADIKSILLTDGILEHGEIHSKPTLMHSLKYSEKVREIQHPSSIMDVGKETEVFMPSSNSANQLIDDMANDIGADNFMFGWWLYSLNVNDKIAVFTRNGNTECLEVGYENLISTIPLNVIRVYFNSEFINTLKLQSSPVYITNFKVENIVPNWLINLYVPERYSPVYRASILNNICSVESMKELDDRDVRNVLDMFFMFRIDGLIERYTWSTGKVISINSDDRSKLVELLANKNIYQIGRFGLWNRKLLIDSTIYQAKQVVKHIVGKITFDALSVVLSK